MKKREVNAGGKLREVLAMDDIVSWCEDNRTKSYNFFGKSFPKMVMAKNLEEDYLDKEAHKEKNSYGLLIGIGVGWMFLGTGMFSGGIVTGTIVWPLIIGWPLGILMLAMGVIMMTSGEKRTEKGRKEAAGWIAFKKHMEEYGQTKKYPIDSIVLWEKYLVYGTALGVSEKVLSQLPIKFPDGDMAVMGAYWVGVNSGGNFGDFSKSISSVSSAISSISSASSGGFGASGREAAAGPREEAEAGVEAVEAEQGDRKNQKRPGSQGR